MASASRTVQCRHLGLEVSGTFEVEGRFLILTSSLGVRRTSLGLQDPRKLAARLLKNLCKAHAARVPCAAVAARSLAAQSREAEVVTGAQRAF